MRILSSGHPDKMDGKKTSHGDVDSSEHHVDEAWISEWKQFIDLLFKYTDRIVLILGLMVMIVVGIEGYTGPGWVVMIHVALQFGRSQYIRETDDPRVKKILTLVIFSIGFYLCFVRFYGAPGWIMIMFISSAVVNGSLLIYLEKHDDPKFWELVKKIFRSKTPKELLPKRLDGIRSKISEATVASRAINILDLVTGILVVVAIGFISYSFPVDRSCYRESYGHRNPEYDRRGYYDRNGFYVYPNSRSNGYYNYNGYQKEEVCLTYIPSLIYLVLHLMVQMMRAVFKIRKNSSQYWRSFSTNFLIFMEGMLMVHGYVSYGWWLTVLALTICTNVAYLLMMDMGKKDEETDAKTTAISNRRHMYQMMKTIDSLVATYGVVVLTTVAISHIREGCSFLIGLPLGLFAVRLLLNRRRASINFHDVPSKMKLLQNGTYCLIILDVILFISSKFFWSTTFNPEFTPKLFYAFLIIATIINIIFADVYRKIKQESDHQKDPFKTVAQKLLEEKKDNTTDTKQSVTQLDVSRLDPVTTGDATHPKDVEIDLSQIDLRDSHDKNRGTDV